MNLRRRCRAPNLSPDEFVRLSKDYAAIEPVAAAAREVRRLRAELEVLNGMLHDPSAEAELKEMAAAEAEEIRHKLPDAERALAIQLLAARRGRRARGDARSARRHGRRRGGAVRRRSAAHVPALRRSAGLAIRADLGLARRKSAATRKRSPRSAAPACSRKLKFESGVHRVQRVPATESGGRIHTSAATVAVLPEAEDVDVQIDDKDLRIDVYRSSGPGGQSVNTTDSAVRITHLPTGLVVIQQDEKSQHKNKAKALKVLRTRLFELERERLASERAGARKSMVGSGDRSERIRTYNFPQGRVTDHRINLTLHKLDEVLEGPGLTEIVDALVAEDEAERLAGLEEA